MAKDDSLGKRVSITLLALAVCYFLVWLSAIAFGRELYPGQYNDVAPMIRKWFQEQKSPLTGQVCCNEADGITVQEDIRQGKYWTKGGPFSEWTPVPDQVVIKAPNLNGAPVLWWMSQDGQPQIRCYAPGALL